MIRFLFLLANIFFIASNASAEQLGVGVPYLPEKLEIIESKDVVTQLINNQISSYPFRFQENDLSPLKVTKQNSSVGSILSFEFPKRLSIAYRQLLSARTVIQGLRHFISNTSEVDSFFHSLKNISSITSEERADSFLVNLNFSGSDHEIIQALENLPLINRDLLELFGDKLGIGSNFPQYGMFTIHHCKPDTRCFLVRNPNFGTEKSHSNVSSINFIKFQNSEDRLKAIRSGRIWIIALPSEAELKDASTDPTLKIIPSPYRHKAYSIPNSVLAKNEFGDFDTSKLIIRAGLSESESFREYFSLNDLFKKAN